MLTAKLMWAPGNGLIPEMSVEQAEMEQQEVTQVKEVL